MAALSRRALLIAGGMSAATSAFDPGMLRRAFAQQLRDIVIGLASPSFAVASGRIAQELGLFQKRGLNARFVIMDSSSAAIQALISGSFKVTIAGFPELVVAQARGQKVVAIGTTYGGFATSLVLSKSVVDKLGVSPSASVSQRLKAVNGLVIATTSATAIGSVAFKNAVQAAGANMRFTYIAQPAMPAALEAGAVDGFLSSAPFWALPVAKGKGVLWINGPKGEFPSEFTPGITALLETTRDFAEANPDLMRQLAAVIADLAQAIDEHPEDVRAAVGRLFPDLDAATIDLLFAYEALGWKNVRHPTVAETAREIAFVKMSGAQAPDIDKLEPAALFIR
jgi:ABC-type nitrate/sulfonate/bicarbonate transport system substrate-binding protein